MTHPSEAADTVDLARAGRTLRRGWRIILACTLAGVLVALAVNTFARPRFDGTATVLLRSGGDDPRASLLSQVQGLAGGLLPSGAGSPIETEVGILSSRAVAAHVVDSLELSVSVLDPEATAPNRIVSGVRTQGSFAPRLYDFTRQANGAYRFVSKLDSGTVVPGSPAQLGVGSLTLASSESLPSHFRLQISDRNDAITDLTEALTVDHAKGELATVKYTANDSLMAGAVPNAIVATYMARRTTTDRGVNQRRVEFLSNKLDSLNGALAEREVDLRRQQESSGVIDPVEVGRLELQRASALRESLTDIEVERAAAEHLIAGVQAHTMTPRQLASFPAFLKGGGVSGLLTQLITVESQRDALLGTRTANDPQVVALDRAATDLENQMLPLTQTYVASLAQQQRGLDQQFDSLRTVIATLPATAQSAGRLQRDVLELSKLTAGVQAQLVDAKLAAIGEGGDVHQLDVAEVPRHASFPRPNLFLAAGAGAGLLGGAMLALIMGSFGRWVQEPLEIERTTGIPALAFDPADPLMLGGAASRSILVAPTDRTAMVQPVVQRLFRTATSRGLSATTLDLTEATAPVDVHGAISRLEQSHDLVIVQLPALASDVAAGALQDGRPVLLVAPQHRAERSRIEASVQLLKRLGVPCAGVVMSGGLAAPRLSIRPWMRSAT